MADASKALRLLAEALHGDNEVVTLTERIVALSEVPVSVLTKINPDDRDHMLFLRDFSDRTIFWRRYISGAALAPFIESETVQ